MARVLLVDDTRTMRTLVRALLGTSHVYVEASNGQEGVEAARKHQPDIILMDINMPVMNGLDALRELKADKQTSHIPVVMVTSRGEEESLRACTRLRCAGYVTKPIDRKALKDAVDEVLQGRTRNA